jgi:hypothetical protein
MNSVAMARFARPTASVIVPLHQMAGLNTYTGMMNNTPSFRQRIYKILIEGQYWPPE